MTIADRQQQILAVIERLEADPAFLSSHWCVPPEIGRLLAMMVQLTRAGRILEIGTSIGYSCLWLGMGTRQAGGLIDTIEASGERLAIAQNHVAEAGLSEQVRFLHGQALSVLERLSTEVLSGARAKYDVIFLDARKDEYLQYLNFAETLLTPSGLLMADNTQSHRGKMQDFITQIHARPHWWVSDMETPGGILLACRR